VRPDEQEPDIRQTGTGERACNCEAHIHQGSGAVDPAGAQGRLSDLPQEIRPVSRKRDCVSPRGGSIAGRKSAEGIVGAGNELGGEDPERLTAPKARTVPVRG
jgi:hypothetical protein